MQSKKLLLAMSGLALSTAFMTSVAFADMSIPNGWYLEANGGSSHLSNTNYPGSSNQSGIGGNANLGYKFMPYLAAEIGYSRYANTTIKSDGVNVATDKLYSYDIAAKGIVPIVDSGFEVFAKLGVGRMNSHFHINDPDAAAVLGISNSQHSATGLYLGAGAQYYFMPELALVAQWQRAQGNDSTGNQDLYTLGLSFLVD